MTLDKGPPDEEGPGTLHDAEPHPQSSADPTTDNTKSKPAASGSDGDGEAALAERRADLRAYLDACLGDTVGRLHVLFGRDLYLTDTGKPEHRRRSVAQCDWPADAEAAVQEILTAAADADVYVCPYVMCGRDRHKGEAVTRTLVHADVDAGLIDVEKVLTLRGFAVSSGSRNHGHVYVALAEPVTVAQHEALCRGLGRYLGAKDSKISDNDVLRPPGTLNHKPTLDGQPPGRVEWLVPPTESTPRTLENLCRQLKVKLPSAEVSVNGQRSTATVPTSSESVDLTTHPDVQAALDKDTGDRSVDTFSVVAACWDDDLTLEQTRYVVRRRADLAERLDERNDDDVLTCWEKVISDVQQYVTEGTIATPGSSPSSSSTPSTPSSSTQIDGMPKLWRATDLKPAAQPRWLARNRIPRAAVTLLIGDEGIGKSLLWVWVVAAVTTGKPLPTFGIPAREPSPVIIVVTEDGWQDTVLPRLEVAGADLDMVRVICTEDDGSGSPIFPRDLFLIIEADPTPALIVVDAWLDTVPGRLSVRDPQQARQALHPFKEIATITDAAVLLLCHTNRVATANARDRYGATGELRKKARMTLYAQTDEDGDLLVGPEKMNTARPIPASKFTITSVQHFDPTEDHDGTVPLLSYAGESEHTAREYLAEAFAAEHDSGVEDNPLAWLAAFLASGPRWVAEIYTAAEAVGYSKDKTKRAKRKLHAESAHDGDVDAWFWRLPQHQGSTPPPYVAPLLPCSLATRSSFQGSASSSQESKRVHGETRAPLRSLASDAEDDDEHATRLGELCTVCHEHPLWAPESIARGVCGGCWQKTKGGTP